jgi:hypothetical protein
MFRKSRSGIMENQYKIHCIEWNPRHVKFDVYDPPGANCGTLTILTDDVLNFITNSWNGDIFWHGKMPKDFLAIV